MAFLSMFCDSLILLLGRKLVGKNFTIVGGESVLGNHLPKDYVLTCRECGWARGIPRTYSVSPDEGRIAGGMGDSCLEVIEFFSITAVPTSGEQVPRKWIGPNMWVDGWVKLLHVHMLSHCDPLFQMRAASGGFRYKKQPEGNDYCKFSGGGREAAGDLDIVGESPGIVLMCLYD